MKKGNNSEIWITGIMWTQERYFLYFSGTNRTKRRKVILVFFLPLYTNVKINSACYQNVLINIFYINILCTCTVCFITWNIRSTCIMYKYMCRWSEPERENNTCTWYLIVQLIIFRCPLILQLFPTVQKALISMT